MTQLIRCRAALREISALFDATVTRDLSWSAHIWPGRLALVITCDGEHRILRTCPWGLPADCFMDQVSLADRTGLFARDLAGGRNGRLVSPALLKRCLIVVEDIAYPSGPAGVRTRSYAGLWEAPLCGWAGLCVDMGDAEGCAGMLMPANTILEAVTAHMPLFLPPDAWASWLAGASLLDLPEGYAPSCWYLEPSDELWSSGIPTEA